MEISILHPQGLDKEGDKVDFVSGGSSDRDGAGEDEDEDEDKPTTTGAISLNKSGEIKWDATIPAGREERFVLVYAVTVPVWRGDFGAVYRLY